MVFITGRLNAAYNALETGLNVSIYICILHDIQNRVAEY